MTHPIVKCTFSVPSTFEGRVNKKDNNIVKKIATAKNKYENPYIWNTAFLVLP